MALEILKSNKIEKKTRFVTFKLSDDKCNEFKRRLKKDGVRLQHFLERVVQAYLDGDIK